MEKILEPYSFADLNVFPGMVHGISPRTMRAANGTREELRMGRVGTETMRPEHHRLFLSAMGIDGEEICLVKQVHGDRIFILENPAMTTKEIASQSADAILTRLTDRPIGVMTADCVPVILYDPDHHAVGVVHAGRRGTALRILSKTVRAMKASYGSSPSRLVAGLGPAIGGCCYEVDEGSIRPFQENYAGWKDFARQKANGRFMLDLWQANRQDARSAGMDLERIFESGECTACGVDRWFSYRREGTVGRMVSLALLRPR